MLKSTSQLGSEARATTADITLTGPTIRTVILTTGRTIGLITGLTMGVITGRTMGTAGIVTTTATIVTTIITGTKLPVLR
jgi:hypothetical protein